MRVIVAPDCFTGTLSAVEAAAAIAAGWLAHAPDDDMILLPMSDGGPGFAASVAASLGGKVHPVVVSGPTRRQVTAEIVVVAPATGPDGQAGGSSTAYVESAQACGLHLLAADERDPSRTTTAGVGQLLVEALATGARRVVVGLGGSGTTDGGEAMIEALGGLDAARERLAGVDLIVASDVDSALFGPQGAVYGFAAQKGARHEQLASLEARMHQWVDEVVVRLTAAGVSAADRIASIAGAGAAGGLGFGLLALGGRREPGAQVVADAVGLESIATGADLLVSGEGSFDWQSLRGKVVTAVARTGQRTGVPVVVLAGRVLVGRREFAAAGIDAAYGVVGKAVTFDQALSQPGATLAALAQRVAATWSPRRDGAAVDTPT